MLYLCTWVHYRGERMATEKVVQLKVRVTADLHKALKLYAVQSGTPMEALVSEAVTALLKRKGAL